MSKVSIILGLSGVVPEPLLDDCLDSLCAQSLQDCEILCVRDASVPDYLCLNRALAADSRVRLFEAEGSGLGAAWNRGIEEAAGEVLFFLHAGTILRYHACEKVLQVMEGHGASLVGFGALSPAAPPEVQEALASRAAEYSAFEASLLLKEHYSVCIDRTAFLRTFIEEKQLGFVEGLAGFEGKVFLFEAYPQASKVVLLSEKLCTVQFSAECQTSYLGDAHIPSIQELFHRVNSLEFIFETWDNLDLIKPHEADLLDWVLEYVGLDLFKQGHIRREAARKRLAELLVEFFGEGFVSRLAGPTQEIFKSIVTPSVKGESPKAHIIAAFYVKRHGKRQSASRVLGAVKAGWKSQSAPGGTSLKSQLLPMLPAKPAKHGKAKKAKRTEHKKHS